MTFESQYATSISMLKWVKSRHPS